jgi:hypothetical protein
MPVKPIGPTSPFSPCGLCNLKTQDRLCDERFE